MRRVLLLSFGHAENSLSLARHLADRMRVTLVFVGAGREMRSGLLDADLSSLPYGLTLDAEAVRAVLPPPVRRYIGEAFRLGFVRTPSRRFLHRDPLLRNWRATLAACARLRAEGFDLVHFSGASGFILYYYHGLRGLPKIWTIHDYVAHSGEGNARAAWTDRLLSRLDFHFVQHYAYLKDRLIEHYRLPPERVHHIYCGPMDVYREFLGEGPRPEAEGYFLFFGRISPYKGIPLLVEAFRRLREARPAARLVIAGSGDLGEARAAIDATPGITCLNRYIPTGELAALVAGSLAVIAPYTDATHSAVVTTAYAFRKPVIATAVGGLDEVVRDGATGHLVAPGSVPELAAAMDRLAARPEAATAMGEAIDAFCRTGPLAWTDIVQRYERLYDDRTGAA